MAKLLMIALGGAFGAVLRYGVSSVVQRQYGGSFPVGTLTVNVLGCLAIGIVGAAVAGPIIIKEEHRVLVLIGLLGSFTTFSTFGWETFELISARQFMRAGLSVALNNGLGFVSVWIGYLIATRWMAMGAT